MSVTIEARGLDDLIAHLGAAATAIPSVGIVLAADAEYAPFVERRFPYLAPAEEQTADQIAALAAEGIVQVIETGDAGALRRNLATGARLVETRAQTIVHVATGFLRSSIHADVEVS